MVSAVRHSLSEPIWEKPTTQCLGWAKAATDSTSNTAATRAKIFPHFFIECLLETFRLIGDYRHDPLARLRAHLLSPLPGDVQKLVQLLVLEPLLHLELQGPDHGGHRAAGVHQGDGVVDGDDGDLPGDVQDVAVLDVPGAAGAGHVDLPA